MIAYFDLISGISGDMTLGALVDLGVPVDWLKAELSALPLRGFDIRVKPVDQSGIRAVDLFVDADTKVHSKNYRDIRRLIEDSPLSEGVKEKSLEAFKKIGVAESKIHGSDLETVHFHEVGGIDAIVDIVGSFLCVEYLGITSVHASIVPLGHGWVKCSHGRIPVPVPATLAILKGVPVRDGGVEMEMVTPTGAAIITTLCDSFGPMPEMVVQGIGYGAGKNKPGDGSEDSAQSDTQPETRLVHKSESGLPNLLRVVLGSAADVQNDGKNGSKEDRGNRGHISPQQVFVIETSIDDMSPEITGYLMDKLLEQGALDVCHISVQMKKNRPGTRIEVVCEPENLDSLVDLILGETSSIGVRYRQEKRAVLARQEVFVDTSFGRIVAKKVIRPKNNVSFIPEFEVCKKIADERKIPLVKVFSQLLGEMNPSGKQE